LNGWFTNLGSDVSQERIEPLGGLQVEEFIMLGKNGSAIPTPQLCHPLPMIPS